MTEAVLADAQFGAIQILRPYVGFEADYEGESVNTPIMFTPNGEALDPQAGKGGYRRDLLRGVGVPLGARVVLMIPLVTAQSGAIAPVGHEYYKWVLWWRLRNLFDYRTRRIPWHFARQQAGVLSDPPGNEEVVIPGLGQPVVYNQDEDTVTIRQINDIKAFEDVNARGRVTVLNRPFVKVNNVATRGAIQQGLLTVSNLSGQDRLTPSFFVHEVQALGDELLIACYRDEDIPERDETDIPTVPRPNWQFTGIGAADGQFSRVFGQQSTEVGKLNFQPVAGVYISVGSAP